MAATDGRPPLPGPAADPSPSASAAGPAAPVFTDRQLQALQLVACGCTVEEIAAALGISRRTAKYHCDTLRHKLGVRMKYQIPVAYLQQTGRSPYPQPQPAARAD